MSQVIFTTIDPADSGTQLATILNDFKNAIVSGLSGTTRPTTLSAGGMWVDTTNDPTYWSFKVWTGSADIEIFRLNLTTSLASVTLAVSEFDIKKVSADTTGAILKLIKNRIASSGQVLDGDTVGTIQFVGRANDASNPVVAYLKWDATDNQTTSAYGGTFSLWSTPDATAAATQHLRLISGLVETIVPQKLNSLRLVSQDVATAATIAQLSGSKVLVEMTGSTVTSIQGIKSTDDSQVVTIHNRSSAAVTLKHQDAGASAVDRLKLPSSTDYVINSDASATLFYDLTDTRWKLLSTCDKNFAGYTVESFYGRVNTWTSPSSVTLARVRAYKKQAGLNDEYGGFNDIYGSAYAFGINTNGNLGLGDVTPRSSPVAVLGGLSFYRLLGLNGGTTNLCNYGISTTGSAYAWGNNTNGQLGVGDVTARSSPVAVLGGLKFLDIFPRDSSVYGLSQGAAPYAWGVNTNGQLGVGDVIPRSSPVAVLGSLKFVKVVPISGAAGAGAAVGITSAGLAYAWGLNTDGNLGVADVTPRSSPVAVVGGITFSNIYGASLSGRYFFNGLNASGAAYSWGSNFRAQLGVGDTTSRSSPVAVLGGLTFKRLIVHPKTETVFGLTSTGALYGWGENSSGQLGVGDTTNRSSPVAVLGGLTFSKVRLYKSSVIAITSDGTAYAWGTNQNGQLGLGDVVSRSSPVAVLGGLKFFELFMPDGATDNNSVYGAIADGTVYSWGANTNGTLGLGDVTPRSSPVAVLGGFRADVSEQSYTTDLTVIASTAYTISLNPGICSFANIPIGQNIGRVEVEYLQ